MEPLQDGTIRLFIKSTLGQSPFFGEYMTSLYLGFERLDKSETNNGEKKRINDLAKRHLQEYSWI